MTRNLEIAQANTFTPVVKKSFAALILSARENGNNLFFIQHFKPNDVNTKGLTALLPEGNHIMFSASESNESAYEIGGEGIFTKCTSIS